eukprot:1869909-Rhodomonas_salina.1
MLDLNGNPIIFTLPNSSNLKIAADTAMMVLMSSLSCPGQTTFSMTFTFMIEYIYDNWAERLGDLSIWEDEFQDFADSVPH